MAPVDDGPYVGFFAFHDGLDPAVGEIPHPAAQAEGAGPLRHGVAEEDPLDVAGDENVRSRDRHGGRPQ